MKEAYVVGQILIIDSLKWQQYRDLVPGTLSPWNAQLVFRGKQAQVWARENPYTDIVVIRFPNLESANSWFHSSAYQELIPLREKAAEVVLTSYEV